jgi:hypothetical protein
VQKEAEDNDKEQKNKGQFYCGTRTFFSSPLAFQTEKKGVQYEGMENILRAHANKMCLYVKGED